MHTEEKPEIPLSVIVPVGPGETCWRNLLTHIDSWDFSPEVIVVFADGDDANAGDFPTSKRCRRVVSPRGRAVQMNAGARTGSHPVLWFLHADSHIDATAANAMWDAASRNPEAIFYLRLAFADDGPRFVKLNAYGAKFRSRWLGLPFGDQGLCLSQRLFFQLGEYDTAAKYGEDHLLVWRAHQQRVPVKPVDGTIVTSARKYAERGWWPTTRQHFVGTWRQAIPEWFKSWKQRKKSSTVDSIAVAIFVKTPGLSPVKTRLAAEIGVSEAERCYRLSVQAVEAVVRAAVERSAITITPYWAVAEPAGTTDALWQNFDGIAQPAGGLGDRLAGVYDRLIVKHRGVIFIGADSPQLTPNTLRDAVRLLTEGTPFVIGPADDGGFYLFGGTLPLPNAVWTGIVYSSEQTGAQLHRQLVGRGDTRFLSPLRDIDRRDDLGAVVEQMASANESWLPEQCDFRDAVKPLLERQRE